MSSTLLPLKLYVAACALIGFRREPARPAAVVPVLLQATKLALDQCFHRSMFYHLRFFLRLRRLRTLR